MTHSLQTTLRRSWPTITLVTLLCMSVAFGVSMTLPKEYSSTFTVLIVERGQNLDSFTAAKSAERLTLSLNRILATTSFADQVRGRLTFAGFTDDHGRLFAQDATQQRKEWLRRFTSRAYPDVGQLKISTFDADRDKAQVLSIAFANVLVDHGAEYVGGGSDIVLKVVDAPLASTIPARPNVPMNMAAAAIVGLFVTTLLGAMRKERSPVQRQLQVARAVAEQPSLVRAAEAMVQARAMPEPVAIPQKEPVYAPTTETVLRPEETTEPMEPLQDERAFANAIAAAQEETPGAGAPSAERIIWRMP